MANEFVDTTPHDGGYGAIRWRDVGDEQVVVAYEETGDRTRSGAVNIATGWIGNLGDDTTVEAGTWDDANTKPLEEFLRRGARRWVGDDLQ